MGFGLQRVGFSFRIYVKRCTWRIMGLRKVMNQVTILILTTYNLAMVPITLLTRSHATPSRV